ncbi:competence type IV pilus minor pilin ComGD [Enterococcus sp. HY326]|uniref:competence type IV pilus minor pilin ComGD n=1 Tax=Enterococcus sp. HY326 TaxID=2971265 RepID=UPI00223EA310|nr:competence type IV pilus minor pilin ComGD [Enterococcus sp. HY326]
MVNKGFTLIESLIALLVVTAFVLLPSLSLAEWQRNVEEKIFFQRFERLITATQQAAITQNSLTKITEDKDQTEFYFWMKNMDKGTLGVQKVLTIPKSVVPKAGVSTKGMMFKEGTGNNTDMLKFSFRLAGRSTEITYQFQLGSGKYVKKISQ